MNYLGVDIGGTAVKLGIVTDYGEILQSELYPVAFDGYETPILETVMKSCAIFLEKNNIKPEKLLGIGISATGQIDTNHRTVAGVGGNIKNWKDSDIGKTFSNLYHIPVTVVNDANCVALGEKWIGKAKDYHNVIVITIGTGIGGGIIVEDKLLLGSSGFAGEFGHFSIKKDGEICTCGNKGCYERYASMTALVRSVQNNIPFKQYPGLTKELVNGKVIFEFVKNNDLIISSIVDQWIEDIVSGLVSLTHIFNPDLILIGGGVSVQEDFLILKIRERLRNKAMVNFGKSLIVESAALGNNAGLVGAVYYLKSLI